MPELLLVTLNAKYAHASFGLRYLHANLGPLQSRAAILELDISERSVDQLERILAQQPKIVGFGVYIWNIDQTTRLVGELKRVAPQITVVLGGPEVSYDYDDLEIVRLADYVVTGEADLSFPRLCEQLLTGLAPAEKMIPGELPQFGQLQLPYDLYTDRDLAQRVVYVEASRGCPYECEFCLSSLDIPVRQAPIDLFLESMQRLLDRGLQQFKFVDRTFNLNLRVSQQILQFFLDRYRDGLFLHFEMIPDRLPNSLRGLISQFPPGALQFEVGIQTFNPEVAALISRRQDLSKTVENLTWLRQETGVHVHADLIVGLPGESLDSFGAGFDQLVALRPHEIQVGILKRLRGTPIIRHDAEWQMVYSPAAPYEILQNRLFDYATLQRMRRFARYWDLVANSGHFVESTPLLWQDRSPFVSFLQFSDWLFARAGQTHGIALKRLAELLFEFLTQEQAIAPLVAAAAIWNDYQRGGHSDRPPFLRPWLTELGVSLRQPREQSSLPRRQARHLS